MATKDSSIEHDVKFLDHLWNNSRWSKNGVISYDQYKTLLNVGEIQIETFIENVMADNSGGTFVKESGDGRDFSDDSDAKKSIVQFHRGRYDAAINSIRNKLGTLRVIVYDKHNNKFHYFKIPKSAYGNISMIEISFNIKNGNESICKPNRNTKWWAYEVDTFEELCNDSLVKNTSNKFF
tara:strand:- start:643 stop:1182 length:540 start_codon:yes stop_codon:yes gene_type:complete